MAAKYKAAWVVSSGGEGGLGIMMLAANGWSKDKPESSLHRVPRAGLCHRITN